MADETWLVMGLGNPGPRYAPTRHNIGQMTVDELADRMSLNLSKTKHGAVAAMGRLGSIGGRPGPRVVLAKSLGYMNVTGGPTQALLKFYSVPPANLIAVHDDVDLDFDAIKLKRGGGEGGHNGLRSITQALGTKDYLRVRAGVGRPPGRMDTASFVLRPFSTDEKKTLPMFISDLADAVEMLVTEGLTETQQKYHSR